MKRASHIFIIACAGLTLSGAASAEVPDSKTAVCTLCDAAESQPYFMQAAGKLGRGVVNALLGWTELLVQPARSHKTGENIVTGIDRGVGYTFHRTIIGPGEFFTFCTRHETPLWTNDCALGELGVTGR